MRRLWNRFTHWLFQIENEIMLPFIAVGILVIGAFGAISFYNGYTLQMEAERSRARIAFQNVRVDLNYLDGKVSDEELLGKFRLYQDRSLRILTGEGELLAGPETLDESMSILEEEKAGGSRDWTLQYILDRSEFLNKIIEEQTYVIVGAVACLLIIVQVSVFLSWSITKPLRKMSATCREIDSNRKDFRKYRFEAVERKDEIGQLARTFETLLKNMDNYTKMEYTSRMSATLAHEIKNPLTGIRSGVQVLKGRLEKENEKLLCDSMLKEIDRVTGLINDLFTLSVRRKNERKSIDLLRFFSEMQTFYEKGLEEQGIVFSLKEEAGLSIEANENELRQILHNLMTNSIKAIKRREDGKKEIVLTARRFGDRVQIGVSDTGCGMTAEELEKALEPFYTRSINGVGLGLAIASRLAEQNGGELSMESEPGKGTSVYLVFETGREDSEKGIDR